MRSLAGLRERPYVKVLAEPTLNMLLDAYIKHSYYDIIYPMRSIKREIDKRIGDKGEKAKFLHQSFGVCLGWAKNKKREVCG